MFWVYSCYSYTHTYYTQLLHDKDKHTWGSCHMCPDPQTHIWVLFERFTPNETHRHAYILYINTSCCSPICLIEDTHPNTYTKHVIIAVYRPFNAMFAQTHLQSLVSISLRDGWACFNVTKMVGGERWRLDKQKASPDVNRKPDRHSAFGFVIQNTNQVSQLTPKDRSCDVGQSQAIGGEGRFTLEIWVVALGSSLNFTVHDWLADSDWHTDNKGAVLVIYIKSRNLFLTENIRMPKVYICPPQKVSASVRFTVDCSMHLTTFLAKG